MNLVRREGFVTALQEGVLWYRAARQEHGQEAAEFLAQRFAAAVDQTIDKITRRLGSGVVWPHHPGYRPWSKSPLTVGWFCIGRPTR